MKNGTLSGFSLARPDGLARLGSLIASLVVFAIAGCGGNGAKPAAVPAPTSTQPEAPAASKELKSADQVLEGSLAAQGGRDRISKIKTMRQTGRLVMPQMGMNGALTILNAAPRQSLATIEVKGFGKILTGVNDDVAWEMNPITGARIISGAERTQSLRESTFNADLIWKELYSKVELGGVVDFAGQRAYKIALTAKEGDTHTRYFSVDTLLPIGMQMVIDSQMGKIPIEMSITDYRDVKGVKYAHKLVRKEGPQTIEIVIETVEPDFEIPPATFDIPPEIKALKKPADPAAKPDDKKPDDKKPAPKK